jgi:hypothetical protein
MALPFSVITPRPVSRLRTLICIVAPAANPLELEELLELDELELDEELLELDELELEDELLELELEDELLELDEELPDTPPQALSAAAAKAMRAVEKVERKVTAYLLLCIGTSLEYHGTQPQGKTPPLVRK